MTEQKIAITAGGTRPGQNTGTVAGRGLRQAAGRPGVRYDIVGTPRRHDATPAQIALAWLLAIADYVLLIPGTSRPTGRWLANRLGMHTVEARRGRSQRVGFQSIG
jgi:hypothetical protein